MIVITTNAEGEGHSAMNNPQRAELLAAIAELCEKYPDWRLGQVVANVAGWRMCANLLALAKWRDYRAVIPSRFRHSAIC